MDQGPVLNSQIRGFANSGFQIWSGDSPWAEALSDLAIEATEDVAAAVLWHLPVSQGHTQESAPLLDRVVVISVERKG
jgi:hypothetical protein